MEGKRVLSFVLLAVFTESARATCPSARSSLPSGCWRSWGSRCYQTSDCLDDQECCVVRRCWGLRYCRKSINPIQVQVNNNNRVNTDGFSTTPIVQTPVQQQAVPTVTEPVQQQAVPTVNTLAQQQEEERRPGRCGRNRECKGNSCKQDGDCPSAKKCCLNGCGRRTCSPILRSSIFFPGKK
ncbi:uncharacterized protein LOC126815572 [Patella vulgata]|uniref:uncharacterized protein LOC126815572 n=1 Tax=Patella vulgata TaxID=6465 RepID=UPI0024A94EEB|nr:uncharacterized protein LOC126815572 [Patella vulgata]